MGNIFFLPSFRHKAFSARRLAPVEFRLVYITAKNLEEARRIGKMLVKEKLAACVNILEDSKSIYFWDGKLQESDEAVLLVKTRETLVPKLIEHVKALHSYSCPCIVTLPILEGNPDYLAWLAKETDPLLHS